MITLKTLNQATAQQVFDQVVTHLMTQGKKSERFTGGSCLYLSDSGLKCAAGCLISDNEYLLQMEGSDWSDLIHYELVPRAHGCLISRLQIVHDEGLNWEKELKQVAKQFKLKFNWSSNG